jgi:hypothetical protein
MKENWEGKLDFQRAESMVRKLAQYVLLMRSEGRSLLGVEENFEVKLPDVVGPVPGEKVPGGDGLSDDDAVGPGQASEALRYAILRGQVDRLEIDAEGQLVVVDLKTGKRQPAKAEVGRHPQLGAYQAAVLGGGFDSVNAPGEGVAMPAFQPGGAILAQLGTSSKSPAIQQQEALDPDGNWALDLVMEAARAMSGSTFEARHDPSKGGHGGHGCRLPEVCPLCLRGKQVTQ